MENFYEEFSEKPKKPSHFWKGVLLGGIVAGLLFLTLFTYYASGSPQPGKENPNSPSTPLPWEEREDSRKEDDNAEVPPEAEQYYMAIVNAVEKATPSVVGISNYGVVFDIWGRSSLQERATGSGVIISSDGYIVTNYHVIENARELVVTLGSGEELPAKVVGADPPTDLAVIKVDRSNLPAAELADSSKVRVGEPAIAIGNPLGLVFQQSVTVGVISARNVQLPFRVRNLRSFRRMQPLMTATAGSAGKYQGKVVGINTAKIKVAGVEGMGFAIPSNMVRK